MINVPMRKFSRLGIIIIVLSPVSNYFTSASPTQGAENQNFALERWRSLPPCPATHPGSVYGLFLAVSHIFQMRR